MLKLVLLWVVSGERQTSCGDPLIMRNFQNWNKLVIMLKMHVCETFGLLPILHIGMYLTPCIDWKCTLLT